MSAPENTGLYVDAFNAAILALNTLQHPDATSAADAAWLDENAEQALTTLVAVRAAFVEQPQVAAALMLSWREAQRMSFGENKILADAEALANMRGEFPPTEQDFEEAEREVRTHVAATGEPYFTETVDDATWTCPGCKQDVLDSNVRRHVMDCEKYDGRYGY